MPQFPQVSASMRPRLERPTATIRIAPWNIYCEKVGAPKMLRPLKPKAMISAPTNVPNTWNSPSRKVAEPRKTAAKARQQIGIGRAGRAAAEARGEQDPGQGRADAGNDKADDLDAVDIYAGEPRRRRDCRRRPESPGRSRCVRREPRARRGRAPSTMIGFGMPNSQRPSARSRKSVRHAGDDRNAGGIGEREA